MRITSSLFEAGLKCPTKCFLRSLGEIGAGNVYAGWIWTQSESYRNDSIKLAANACSNWERIVGVTPVEKLKAAKWKLALGFVAQSENLESSVHAVERFASEGRGRPAQFVPIRFVYANRLTRDDKLMLAFDALVLSEMLGREVGLGKIIHGDGRATLRLRTSALAGEVRKHTGRIAALLSTNVQPELVLNRHCTECEFRARCRQKAVEKDDLSLLSGITDKERKKFNSKGIFTVTQLSYTFRPRRRPKRLAEKRERSHHSLKALAIREQKIHIVGRLELKVDGTPVYLDVEGLPDRSFYYLIGVLVGTAHGIFQHSLWAERVDEEKRIWTEFLNTLSAIDNPVLVHYGSFETIFLKQMCQRYGGPPEGSTSAKAIKSAVNLLSSVFGQIYFPTYSNGLKDLARFLGFNWSDVNASGTQSIVWRQEWEGSQEPSLKQRLITYNSEDCLALELVARIVRELGLPTSETTGEPGDRGVVDVESLRIKKPWHDFSSSIPGFEEINRAAHWDYQRDRVYVRSSKKLHKLAIRRRAHAISMPRATKVVNILGQGYCPACSQTEIIKTRTVRQTLYDIQMSPYGLRRRIAEYHYHLYRCSKCQNRFGAPEDFWPKSKYGRNLVAYTVYQLVELYIPMHVIVRSLNRLFGFGLTQAIIHNLKVSASRAYEKTAEAILSNLVRGSLLHVDETRVNVKGKAAYVWVFTNLCEVAYIYSDTREGEMVQGLLLEFKGVLVSDFYSAYDALDCPQQKCLIHLMRDLNDAVLEHPFDEGLKQIVRDFAELLRPMIETVDRFGLKKHFLGKYLVFVERFYERVRKTASHSEAEEKCKQRFEKNRDKLFTFLRYDGVPWNNNNAEHAIRAFAKLREVIQGPCTAKGVEEYLVLLSVRQTCAYQGIDFLNFLRSGERNIDVFADREGRRGKRTWEPTRARALPAESFGDRLGMLPVR